MFSIKFFLCVMLLVQLTVCFCASASQPEKHIQLVKDSTATFHIVIAPGSGKTDDYDYALILQNYIKQISGATVQISPTGGTMDGPVIFVGKHWRASEIAGKDLSDQNVGAQGFVIRSKGQHIALIGLTPHGTRNAVYAFIEELGCRFYMPIEAGFVVPTKRDISIRPLDRVEKPFFQSREFFYNGWVQSGVVKTKNGWKMRYEWGRALRLSPMYINTSHSFKRIVPPELFNEHPEYFPMRNGKRFFTKDYPVQRCLSNPDLPNMFLEAAKKYFDQHPERIGFSITPNDTLGQWCECQACKKMGSFAGHYTPDRLMLRFASRLATELRKDIKYNDKYISYIGFYRNNHTTTPPVGEPKVKGVIVQLCSPTDIYHLPNATDYSRRSNAIIQEWSQVVSEPLAIYEWYWYAGPKFGIWSPQVYAVGPRIKYYAQQNVRHYRGEFCGTSPDTFLAYYIAAKKMWNPDEDENVILDEFFKLYFGLAKEPMRKYYDLLNRGFHQTEVLTQTVSPRYTGYDQNMYWPYEAWSDSQFDQMDQLLTKSFSAVVKGSVYETRIRQHRDAHNVFVLYIKIARQFYSQGSTDELIENLEKIDQFVTSYPDQLSMNAYPMHAQYIPSLIRKIRKSLKSAKEK